MKKRALAFAFAVILCLGIAPVDLFAEDIQDDEIDWLRTRQIIYKDDPLSFTSIPQIEAIISSMEGVSITQLSDSAYLIISDAGLEPLNNIMAQIKDIDPSVRFGYDYPIALDASNISTTEGVSSPPSSGSSFLVQPKDPLFEQMKPYVYEPIRLPEALSITSGVSGTVISLVDTVPISNEHFLIQSGEYKIRYNFRYPPTATGPGLLPHGHVSLSLVGSQFNGQYNGGGCPNCTIDRHAVHVGGLRFLSDLIFMLNSVSNTSADVYNIAFGIPVNEPTIRSILDKVTNKGNVVASTGLDPYFPIFNEKGPPWFPANQPDVIGVGSTGLKNGSEIDPFKIADYSNNQPDIVAPGTSVYVPIKFNSIGNATYQAMDGTGASAALVSSTLGLLWSQYRANPARFPKFTSMTRDKQVEYFSQLIKRTATDLGDPGFDSVYGAGLINAALALKQMELDQLADMADNLTHGYQEWEHNEKGGPVYTQAQIEFQNKVPRTTAKVNQRFFFGSSCSAPTHIKIESGRPRFDYRLEEFSMDIVSLQGDTAHVRMMYAPRIYGYVRLKLRTFLNCPSIFPSINITVNFSYGRAAQKAVHDVFLKLEADNYRIKDTNVIDPVRQFVVDDISTSLPSWLDHSIRTKVRKEFNKYIQGQVGLSLGLLVAEVHKDLERLPEALLDVTLFAKRNSTAPVDYLNFRLGDKLPGNIFFDTGSKNTNFTHQTHSGLSTFGMRTLEIPGEKGVPPLNNTLPTSQPISYEGQHSGDSTTYVGEELINAQLRTVYQLGAFQNYNPLLVDQRFKAITPTHPNDVTFEILNIKPMAQPIMQFYNSPNASGHIGKIVSALEMDFNYHYTYQGVPKSETQHIQVGFEMPILNYTTYKDRPDDAEGRLSPSDYYGKIVPDTNNDMTLILGFVPDPDGVVSYQDVEDLIDNTVRMGVLRVLHSVSFTKNGIDANIGHWGAIAHIAHFFNQISRDIKLEDIKDEEYFDLNLGYWGPDKSVPVYVNNQSHFIQKFKEVRKRTAVLDQRAIFGNDIRNNIFSVVHLLDPKVARHYIRVPIASATTGEVTFAPNHHYRDSFPPGRANVDVYVAEDLFVYRVLKQNNLKNIYLSLKSHPIRHDFYLSGDSRHKVELNHSKDCNDAVDINWAHDGRAPELDIHVVGKYSENTIFEAKDERKKQTCENGRVVRKSGPGNLDDPGGGGGTVNTDVPTTGMPPSE